MGLIATIALKVFTQSTLSFVSNVVKNLSDAHVAVVQANTSLDIAQVGGVVNAEIARTATVADIMGQMMKHPIWWVGWVLFVLPPGFYDALIHLKSIACPFYAVACTWNILEVPATQEYWDKLVVLSFFGYAAVSPAIAVIANRIGKH